MNVFYEDIQDFLANGIIVGDLLLPARYARFERLDDFQVGFRTHGHSGESLVSDTDGGWNSDWYVLAMTGLDDPIFIATREAESGYPVYTAAHGAGRWDATQIAPSLAAFSRLLAALTETTEDFARFKNLIIAETGPPNAFWREVLEERQRAAVSEQAPPAVGGYNPADFESGDLIVNNLGRHKLKVVQIISKCRGLSLKDTLALAEAPELLAGSGVRLHLRRLSEQLEALGATVEFRNHPPCYPPKP